MSLQKINTRTIVLILIIITTAAMRLLSYKYQFLSNFTPVGAISLFGGVYFTDKRKAFLVVLASLVISDLAINYMYFSKIELFSSSIWLYGCFALMIFIGSLIKKVTILSITLGSLAGLAIHWLIMDMPWIYTPALYPTTLAGYGQSLIAAIPFERNMLYGDALFCTILFGGFELAQSKYTVLRTKKKLAV